MTLTLPPVLPTKRKPLTKRQRVRMHDEHGSKCVVCLEPIPAGEPFIDEHIIPLAIGGSNDASNRGPAHVGCAKIKTVRDQAVIAKSYRVRARHLGIKKTPKGRPIPGTKRSGWKNTFSHGWVRR